ncbi:MAG: M28 family peptidase [Candidatus Baltobacteraceae bacterium]
MRRGRLAAACLLAPFVAACNAAWSPQPPAVPASTAQGRQADPQICRHRANDTIEKLEACIRRAELWQELSQFAQIADENPGPDGHPNRNTGTPGYAASVAYVQMQMQRAGYDVTIQRYVYRNTELAATPQFATAGRSYVFERDWYVARGSAAGTLTAPVEPSRGDGCAPADFDRFTPGDVALMPRGKCDFDTQVANAQGAGAAAAVLYDSSQEAAAGAFEARLVDAATIPVIGVATYEIGNDLLRAYRSGVAPTARIDVRTRSRSDIDYNVIADSPYGDPKKTVVVEGHLDSIHGAGMLDNASGSTTILDVALNLAKTPTRNRLRYIWFGGEEIGLLGSRYYTTHLTKAELHRIVFDVDADVTATPNFDILIADPKYASKVHRFPPNVIPASKIGNEYFEHFFKAGGVVAQPAWFGNDGTDSFSFAVVGIPDTGILTQQDCCKHAWETALWGGFLGNYEGDIPSRNGGCVDRPHRWCDNLSNNDPFVLELASKAVAYVTFELANRRFAEPETGI